MKAEFFMDEDFNVYSDKPDLVTITGILTGNNHNPCSRSWRTWKEGSIRRTKNGIKLLRKPRARFLSFTFELKSQQEAVA